MKMFGNPFDKWQNSHLTSLVKQVYDNEGRQQLLNTQLEAFSLYYNCYEAMKENLNTFHHGTSAKPKMKLLRGVCLKSLSLFGWK